MFTPTLKSLPKLLTTALNVEQFVRAITLETVSFWRTQAGKRLSSFRERYQNSVQVVLGETSSVVYLTGQDNVDLEVGFKSFDMKPGLLGRGQYLSRVIPVSIDAYRTVSINSPASSWIHPGRAGLNIREDAVQFLTDDIIPRYTHLLFK